MVNSLFLQVIVSETEKDGKFVTDGRRAFFMGNALVIGLIERVGKVIAKDLIKL